MGQRTNLLLQVEGRSGARLNRVYHLQWGYSALSPTPENHFPVLDAMDDCYLVLPLGSEPTDHLHIPPTHTFILQHPLNKGNINYLYNHLILYQGNQDNAKKSQVGCNIFKNPIL